MKSVNVHAAKTQLSKLIDQAAAGEDVILSRNGKPLVRMTRLEQRGGRKIRYGLLKGKVTVPADFDEPLSAVVLARFE